MPTPFTAGIRGPGMSKTLSWTLRVAVAAVGVTYIFFALNFTDRVVVPADTTLPDGHVLAEALSFEVVSGDLATAGDPGAPPIVLRVGAAGGPEREMLVPPGRVGVSVSDFQPDPGVMTILRGADLGMLAAGMFVISPIYLIITVRWWLLLRASGLTVPRRHVFRLTMVGNFLNFCMPVGTTGGDVVKAYYAAKHTDRRTDAVMTIVMDRIAGLLGLVVLALGAGLMMWHEPMVRRVTTTMAVAVGLAAVAGLIYFNPFLRRCGGVQWLLQRLPAQGFVRQVDTAAVAYRHHKGLITLAVGFGVVVHLLVATSTAFAGYALGAGTPFGVMLNVVPVLFLAAAVSPIYQGLGIMELVATALLLAPPVTTANQIVGMLLLARLYQMTWSLIGIPLMLGGDIHLRPEKRRPTTVSQRAN